MSHVGKSRSQQRRSGDVNTIYNEGSQHTCSRRDNLEDTECTTDVWQRVLWGSKQRVQGNNGSNAAQLSCLQGTTLTFQLNAGVPCGTGLRHGDHAPEGATFEGSQDPAAAWIDELDGP